jgi:hypothetical protein
MSGAASSALIRPAAASSAAEPVHDLPGRGHKAAERAGRVTAGVGGVGRNVLSHAGIRTTVTLSAALALVLALGLPAAASTARPASASGGTAAAAITDISKACPGSNAEVEQATHGRYIYEEWMDCGASASIGFATSADGGRTWSPAITLPGSAGAWDPAVTVSPEGVIYASFMFSASVDNNNYTYPVVDVSYDNGVTFSQSTQVNPNVNNNWGDRDFIVAGPHGVVYLTWDYGPSAAEVQFICSPTGSCGYSAGDVNVVVQKSTDDGRTWGPIIPVSPGFPASGGDSAPLVLERNGDIAVAYQGYDISNTTTYAMNPAYMYFTQSSDGGTTWSVPVRIGAEAGTMSLAEWWIDGAIGEDAAGDLYITWDTQGATSDIGWLSFSANDGRTWSPAIRVTPDTDNATHIVEVAGGRPGVAYVAWLADNPGAGYAEYFRPFSLRQGWLSGPITVSQQYGNANIWPGDTFGISTLPGERVALSWGSAVGSSQDSAIWATVLKASGGG